MAEIASEGQRLAVALVKRLGAAEVGRRVRTSEGMVRHLATGRKTPGDALKLRLSEVFDVAPETWDAPPAEAPAKKKAGKAAVQTEGLAKTSKPRSAPSKVSPAAAVPPVAPVVPSVPPAPKKGAARSGIEEIRSALELLEERIEELAADAYAPVASWVALLKAKADAGEKLAKLQGEGEITEAAILRSKAWRAMLERLAPVLERHPKAAEEILAVLEALDG